MKRKLSIFSFISAGIPTTLLMLQPRSASAHLVNSNVSEFYAGMLHPVTSPEYLLLLAALALLASQCGKKAACSAILLFPFALMIGILAGSEFPMNNLFHYANLALMCILGMLLAFSHRLTWVAAACSAVVSGLVLGWRSGIGWAVSGAGWLFVPGAAMTGFILLVVVTTWIPQASGKRQFLLKKIVGIGFALVGVGMAGYLLSGSGSGFKGIGLPTEESLKGLVAAPELSLSFIIGASGVSMLWGAAHALTPGHGKAIVGAYLVGSRGTAWHAIYLGLTVTVTHTLGVFILGLVATLAAAHMQPEELYPYLGVLSGLMIFILGAFMLFRRIKLSGNHSHSGVGSDEHRHHNNSKGEHHHHHGDHSHSHLPPGSDDGKLTWRSLLALGISGGLLPCPAAMVLLLTAIALHRIGFGIALVAAFSVGLAAVLTVVGLLFIKGSHFFNSVPSLSSAGRWLPILSALIVCFLGGGITLNALSGMLQ